MRIFLAFLVLGLAVRSALAAEYDGRLPRGCVPRQYAIRLEPDAAHASFTGRVKIAIELSDRGQDEAGRLVLNSLELVIQSATIDGQPLTAKTDDAAQTLTLTGSPIPAGKHQLEITFSGKLSERPEGLYLTRYQLPDGSWQKALVTQMEPADARRMFPCWDEPAYRSAFQLTAVVPAKDTALFNMPIERETPLDGGRKEVVFGTTPPMASYLVAFSSAQLESLEDEVEGIKLRIFATPGKRNQMAFAMEATKKILPYYHEYFGVKYPLPKLDQVCFPSVSAGGMENWGCIVYADTALLYDDRQPAQAKERVFGIVAHEIAHQWFGDLVTMEWWDNLWLNEGFASWMATKAGAHFYPEWKKWERAAGGKEAAMRLDARATTHPIQQPVVTAAQAMEVFDEITYQKGQAFLRMLELWLGEDKFRDGLRGYFAEHANGNTVTEDLWKALSKASGQYVGTVAHGWTEQPGFPLVTASPAGEGKLALAQHRFTIHQPEPAPLHWQIPVTLRPLTAGARPRTTVLGVEPEILAAPLPALVNAGAAGYFRVRYEGAAWDQLLPHLPALDEVDRLAILHDTWAMVQSGEAPMTNWLAAAAMLKDDPSPLVIGEMAGVFGFLDHEARGTPLRPRIRALAREFLTPAWQRLGWKPAAQEDPATANLRGELLAMLAEFGDSEIESHARELGGHYLDDPSSLPADLREAVLHVAGRAADAAWWDRLHALARKTSDTWEKSMLYGALASPRDPALAQRALATSLSGELPAKLAARMVERVAGEGEQPEAAWAFARAHLSDLLSLCSVWEANGYLARLARSFSDAARADELEAVTRSSLPPDAAYAARLATDEIRFKAEFKQRVLPQLADWLASHPGGDGGR